MGQLVEWPEVVTEGKTIEDCRRMLQDALREMILAYKQQNKEIPYVNFDGIIKDHPLREKGIPFLRKKINQLRYDTAVRFFPLQASRRNGRQTPALNIDFHYGPLDENHDRMIREIAEATGYSINTVICAGLYRALRPSDMVNTKKTRIVFTVSLRDCVQPEYRDSFQNLMITAGMNLEAQYEDTTDLLNDISSRVDGIRSGGVFTLYEGWNVINRIAKIPFFRRFLPKLLKFLTGTSICYSNPGRISEQLSEFGDSKHPVLEYIGFGSLIPPYELILYSPEVNGRLFLNAIYRSDSIEDIDSEIIGPLKSSLKEMAAECSKLSLIHI